MLGLRCIVVIHVSPTVKKLCLIAVKQSRIPFQNYHMGAYVPNYKQTRHPFYWSTISCTSNLRSANTVSGIFSIVSDWASRSFSVILASVTKTKFGKLLFYHWNSIYQVYPQYKWWCFTVKNNVWRADQNDFYLFSTNSGYCLISFNIWEQRIDLWVQCCFPN